jgi:hypothetical protein
MPTPQNRNNTAAGSGTAKKTHTATRSGNDHGSIGLGLIDKKSAVISDLILQASAGRHSIVLDKNGGRKGTTTSTSPGRFQLLCGVEEDSSKDTLYLEAQHGNIVIKATNGRIRLEGVDIDLMAIGEGGSKGNIRMKASETVEIDGKKVLINAKSMYKLATAGRAEIIANSSMKIYSSIIRGVTDACATKDSKTGNRKFQQEQQLKK